MNNKKTTPAQTYSWNKLIKMVLSHKRELLVANLVAIAGTALAVPVPLLIPLLVDEVLLDKPGAAIGLINPLFPENWH